MDSNAMTAEELAQFFHSTYERLAPAFGYKTNPKTRLFDANSRNGRLMIATCRAVLQQLETK